MNEPIRIGDIIEFGQYPQGENGEIAPLEWRVLNIQDGRALLITDKLVDCQKYHEEYVAVTWETCSLRQWLNREFINNAFRRSEQAQKAEMSRKTKSLY